MTATVLYLGPTSSLLSLKATAAGSYSLSLLTASGHHLDTFMVEVSAATVEPVQCQILTANGSALPGVLAVAAGTEVSLYVVERDAFGNGVAWVDAQPGGGAAVFAQAWSGTEMLWARSEPVSGASAATHR